MDFFLAFLQFFKVKALRKKTFGDTFSPDVLLRSEINQSSNSGQVILFHFVSKCCQYRAQQNFTFPLQTYFFKCGHEIIEHFFL